MGNNSLTGTVPSELGNLTRLYELTLDSNSLTGTVPGALTGVTDLYRLHFDDNDGICAPTDSAFQNWLSEVYDVEGSNCGDAVATATPTPTPVPDSDADTHAYIYAHADTHAQRVPHHAFGQLTPERKLPHPTLNLGSGYDAGPVLYHKARPKGEAGQRQLGLWQRGR